MHKILYLLPSLDYRGTAEQVRLLATDLRTHGYTPHVCALGTSGPVADRLSAAGIPWTNLGWKRWFDASAWLQLRQLLQEFRPDTIHAWGVSAVPLGSLARFGPRLLCSSVLLPRRMGHVTAWLYRTLLDRVNRFLVGSPAEVERYHHLGISPERVQYAPLGVASGYAGPASPPPGLPEDARLLLCVGPVEPHKGFRIAIWALDILRYLYRDLHLVIVGEGPDVPRLKQFARSIAVAPYVHFVGRQADVAPWLRAAHVVWVPTLTHGGTQVALEGMAAGRPIVASRVAELAEVVADGLTGYLVPPGNPVALARQTRQLLDNADLCREQGDAGQGRVQQAFSVEHLVRRFAGLYNAPTA